MNMMKSISRAAFPMTVLVLTGCTAYAPPPPPAPAAAAAPAPAPLPPLPDTADATLKVYQSAGATGTSAGWASGELSYKGKTYRVRIENTAGSKNLDFVQRFGTANVYDLHSLKNFEGTYATAYPDSGDVSRLRNQQGVLIAMQYSSTDLEPRTAENGYRVSFVR